MGVIRKVSGVATAVSGVVRGVATAVSGVVWGVSGAVMAVSGVVWGALRGVSKIRVLCRLPESRGCWIAIVALVLVIGIVLLWVFWGWLSGGEIEGEPSSEPRSATIRNAGFIIAGLVTLPLLIWRGVVADKHASAARDQAETAQRSLLNKRYQKAAGRLRANDISERLNGVSDLRHLASEHPEQYHIQIVERLCDFARHPTKDEDYEKELAEHNADTSKLPKPREDVQVIMNFLASRNETQLNLEKKQGFRLNFIGADLSHVQIIETDLSGAMLNDTNLYHANIVSVNLSHTYLILTIMRDATLVNIDFSGASVFNIDLSGAKVFQYDKPLFDLDYANLSGATLHRVDLSGRHIQNSILKSAQIIDSNLSNTYFLDSNLSDVKFIRTDTSGAEFIRTDTSGTGLIIPSKERE